MKMLYLGENKKGYESGKVYDLITAIGFGNVFVRDVNFTKNKNIEYRDIERLFEDWKMVEELKQENKEDWSDF